MNTFKIVAVMACGLLLLDAPEAAAHGAKHKQHRAPHYTYYDSYRRHAYSRDRHRKHYYGGSYRRTKHMPLWVKRDRSFRRWFERSRLRRNYRLSWYQLYDIYRLDRRHYRYRHY